MAKSDTQVFFRLVKAPKGHPYSGLVGVEKVVIKAGAIVDKELVHEWDLRILSEAALSRMGGVAAYEAFKYDLGGEPEDLTGKSSAPEIEPRDLKGLTKNKLSRELKLKAE